MTNCSQSFKYSPGESIREEKNIRKNEISALRSYLGSLHKTWLRDKVLQQFHVKYPTLEFGKMTLSLQILVCPAIQIEQQN